MIKPIHTTKYLDIKSYLEFKKLDEKAGGNWEKLNDFFKAHDLPTTDDLRDKNLRMYIWSSVPVEIYDMNQIKRVDSIEDEEFELNTKGVVLV